MLKNRNWIIIAALLASISLATVAEAQLKMPFKRRTSTAATPQSIQLSQANGPWLVMCASFDGERGMQQAMQLAAELRNDHRMNAYIYRHHFDHSKKVQGSGWKKPQDESSSPEWQEWQAASADNYEKIAVLVGDYAAVDDRKATEALQRIKSLMPRSLTNNAYAESQQSAEQQYRARGRGPLHAAFLMPNPLLPADFFNSRSVDKTVVKLNKGVRHSLLKCRGQYTVRVATFSGEKTFNVDQATIERAKREDQSRTRRESEAIDALHKANVLCRALRKKGIEAYEYHDRHESYVCIGSFDWATRQLENGKDYLNPEIADIIQQYKAIPMRTHRGVGTVKRTLAAFKDLGLEFDSQPMPIVVPKVDARTAKRGRGLLGR